MTMHPHVPHELKDFSKHLVATFLGLLMALGLEQWREHRHETKLAQEALTTVEFELKEDLAQVQRELARSETSIQGIDTLVAYLDGVLAAKRQGRPLPEPPKLETLGMSLTFSVDAWETFKGLGALRHLAPDRARRLSRCYLTLGALRQRHDSHPILRHVPARLFLYAEHLDEVPQLDAARLVEMKEGAQLLRTFFTWCKEGLVFAQKHCEDGLKP